ncbi:MAG: VWA domain-containing protein [Leucothrix sp.]
MSFLADFHFLYPVWFLLVPLVVLMWWWLARQNTQNQAWQNFIDERLKPFVISGQDAGGSHWLRHGLLLVSLLAILALAGPSWQKRQLPAFQAQQGLVVVLDLSLSMLAADVSPNRINRARFKLLDLLKIRQEGQTGLVVFAGDAFAVSPLTDDVENIIEQAKNLSPSIMPVQGSLIYRGIDEAALLLQQAGYATGDIFVIADGAGDLTRTLQSAEASSAAGYKISVAAIGTKNGAPIPISQNTYLKDSRGQPVVATLDVGPLAQIAQKGGGLFQQFSLSDDDIERFQAFFAKDKSSVLDDKKTTVEHWHNEGIWLLWLLLLPLLLLFRKGYLFSVGLCVFAVGIIAPQPASAFTWDELWLNADQRAHQALLDKKPQEAKDLFKSQHWKAAAAYRNGDFDESASLLDASNTADGHYNRGNALAKSGKLDEAINAYDQALTLQSDHEDARFNQDILKKMQKEQQKNQQQQNQQNPDNQQQDKKGEKGKDKQSQQGQQDKKNQQDSQQSKDDQQAQPEEAKKNADAAKKQAEAEAKQRAEAEKQQQTAKKPEKKQGESQPEKHEMTEAEKEQAKQTQQWLHQIPDDSAGLWRRKFQYQYRQRRPAGAPNQRGAQAW